MQQQSSSSSSNRFIEHDVCWKTKNSVVECKASENVCENLLDVLGESETYFLPLGWKLENHQLKFSSRLPLRNIHHIPVRGPRATDLKFQFFDHRVTCRSTLMQGPPDRALRGSVLSIATKIVPRPRFSVYIRMVENTWWPPWSIPRTGPAGTILVAIESRFLSSAAAAWEACACARTRKIKMSTSARSQSLKTGASASLAHLSSCKIDDDFDHQDSKTRWCLLVLSQLYKSRAEGNCEDIQRHLSRPWNCLRTQLAERCAAASSCHRLTNRPASSSQGERFCFAEFELQWVLCCSVAG